MQGIDLIDQVGRDEAGNDAENRAQQGQELEDRCIENDGTPGYGYGEDEDTVADNGLADFFFRDETAQDIHGNTLAGFTEAKEDTEEGCHNGEDVEDKAENLDGAAIETSGDDSQSRNVLGVSDDGLVMAESQVEGHGIRENRDEQDGESDFHSPHGFITGDVNRFIMRAIGNDHRADAGNEENRGQRDRQHGNRILDQVAQVREDTDIGQVPVLDHDAAQADDD